MPRNAGCTYVVVSGRLWRQANPALPEELRERLIHDLVDARRAIGDARSHKDNSSETEARQWVHAAKNALGERAPSSGKMARGDYSGHSAQNPSCADWFPVVTV